MTDTLTLDQSQLDRLANLGTAAAERATDQTAKLLNGQVTIQAATTEVMTATSFESTFADAEQVYHGVVMRVVADLNGFVMLLIPEMELKGLAVQIAGEVAEPDLPQLSELEKSAITELGNIVGGSLLSQIADSTGIHTLYSVPDSATDMVKALLDELSTQMEIHSPQTLILSVSLDLQPVGTSAQLVLLLDEQSSQLVVESL